MEKIDLRELRILYKNNINIIDYLSNNEKMNFPRETLVELAYDLQSGSYVDFARDNSSRFKSYTDEISNIIQPYVKRGGSVADIGTGEMTTLNALLSGSLSAAKKIYAVDISISRLITGISYVSENNIDAINKIKPISATLFQLPFADDSIDLVWSSHALEPNGGREFEALSELARVTKKNLVLFEPSYENNTPAGRDRMDKLGYIKGLPNAIENTPGIELIDIIKVESAINPENPTYAYVMQKYSPQKNDSFELVCPLTHGSLTMRDGYIFSPNALSSFPIVENIPILRIDKAVFSSIIDKY